MTEQLPLHRSIKWKMTKTCDISGCHMSLNKQNKNVITDQWTDKYNPWHHWICDHCYLDFNERVNNGESHEEAWEHISIRQCGESSLTNP